MTLVLLFVIVTKWPLVSLGFRFRRALHNFKSTCLSVRFVEREITDTDSGDIKGLKSFKKQLVLCMSS
mgnify:CR=1 FL=1